MFMTLPSVSAGPPSGGGFVVQIDPYHACLKDAELVRFSLNRILKGLGMILCALAVPLLAVVIRRFISKGPFHSNIKLLLHCYFINAFLQAFILALCMGYMVYASFSPDPCGVYLNQTVYIIGHLSTFYLLIAQVNLQTVICFERVVATVFLASYDRMGSRLGVALSLLALLSPIAIMYGMYFDEDFTQRQPSVIIPPERIRMRINLFCVYCIFFFLVSMSLLKFLHCYNGRRVRELIGQVQRRFQTNENLFTTSFITFILGIQLIIYLVGACGLLMLRLAEPYYNKYDLCIQTLKTSLFLVPIFLILLPLATIWDFTRVKKNRQKVSLEQVYIKATGEEGIQNYQKVIYDLWN